MESIQSHSTILVLNSSYEPLHFTNWKRAVILLFKEKAKVISSRVIRLVNYVIIPFRRMNNMYPTKNLIYKRDKNKCQYCGSTKSLTIDHVIPRSRGGKDTWENLVVACSPCNVKKGDKILFGKWSGTEVKMNGEDYLIMKESDIMGIITSSKKKKK